MSETARMFSVIGRRALLLARRLAARFLLLLLRDTWSDWSWSSLLLSASTKWRTMLVVLGFWDGSSTAARMLAGDILNSAPSCILSRSSLVYRSSPPCQTRFTNNVLQHSRYIVSIIHSFMVASSGYIIRYESNVCFREWRWWWWRWW